MNQTTAVDNGHNGHTVMKMTEDVGYILDNVERLPGILPSAMPPFHGHQLVARCRAPWVV